MRLQTPSQRGRSASCGSWDYSLAKPGGLISPAVTEKEAGGFWGCSWGKFPGLDPPACFSRCPPGAAEDGLPGAGGAADPGLCAADHSRGGGPALAGAGREAGQGVQAADGRLRGPAPRQDGHGGQRGEGGRAPPGLLRALESWMEKASGMFKSSFEPALPNTPG